MSINQAKQHQEHVILDNAYRSVSIDVHAKPARVKITTYDPVSGHDAVWVTFAELGQIHSAAQKSMQAMADQRRLVASREALTRVPSASVCASAR